MTLEILLKEANIALFHELQKNGPRLGSNSRIGSRRPAGGRTTRSKPKDRHD